MAPIALALCIAFSALLIVRDVMRRKSVSAARWVPTFLLLILGLRPVSLWLGGHLQFGVTGGNESQRSVVDEVFFLLVLGSSWVITIWRRVKWGKIFAANIAIMALYLFFAISVLWSSDPLVSTTRLCKDFGLLFVIAVILSEKASARSTPSYLLQMCVGTISAFRGSHKVVPDLG